MKKRLRSEFNFVVHVNGQQLNIIEPPAQSIGPVLLLPLRPIIEALGDTLNYDAQKQVVKVLRIQDYATISMDLNTGLTRINNKIIGISSDMQLADPQKLLLPSNAIETLTGTHVQSLAGINHVHIDFDEQLLDIIAPSAGVLEQAKQEPFVLEIIRFSASEDRTNTLKVNCHYKALNTLFVMKRTNYPSQ